MPNSRRYRSVAARNRSHDRNHERVGEVGSGDSVSPREWKGRLRNLHGASATFAIQQEAGADDRVIETACTNLLLAARTPPQRFALVPIEQRGRRGWNLTLLDVMYSNRPRNCVRRADAKTFKTPSYSVALTSAAVERRPQALISRVEKHVQQK